MAALNFPDPAVTQEFEAAGILWTWNATLGVWSSDLGGSSDEFLSKVNDDTAAGEIAFEKLTTHEDGIETAIIQGSGNSPSSPLQIANYKFNGNKLASLKGNAAMSLLSTKGKYNFRDGTDSDNTGEIQAGKVSAQGGVSVTGGDETTINRGIGVSDLDRLALINDNKSIATFGKDGLTYGMYLNSDLQLTQTGSAPHVVQVDYYGTGHVNTAELAIYAGVCKSDAGCNLDMFSARQGNVYPQSAAGIRVTGFYSNTSPDVVTGAGSKAYNFYAAGTAPSYFQGDIQCDGKINGAFSLRMQSDDPTAFQTTYSTDDEGNQVENQEYIGTTEDLLSIIKDLRSRITELESNTLQPLYSTLADLPDASAHHGKTAHVHSEGALYFAHAGNWVKLQNA